MFEQLYKPKFLKSKPRYAFLLGFAYCIIGVFSAKLIFGSNPGLMSVAFTSILLIPLLNNLLSISEKAETREKGFNLKVLFMDHKDLFKIYFLAFMGIFCAYLIFAIVWPVDFSIFYLSPQLKVAGIAGSAINGNSAFFFNILKNNMIVLIACLFLSFFYGAGSILFIAWNASVWGSVFGFRIKEVIIYSNQNWASAFLYTIIPVLPHMITEGLSYFAAAIVGGVVSKAFLSEQFGSKRFKKVINDAMIFFVLAFILVVVGAFLEVYIFPYLVSWISHI
ncbi:MAG: stage II sporulation protein M [Candidatus Woesearchaeota archaeon]